MTNTIRTADLDWQSIDGIEIPVSKQFGDVYFSKDNGLLETRHVFLNGNDLSTRLAHLKDFEYFSVAETGFGTGLNILALWQLWQEVRPNNHSHLHAASVEKFPLSKKDLIRALNAWPELKDLADQLIEQYPLPISGCHRLNFPNERFSIDLWLGDAHDIFPVIEKTKAVDAWFLDGFAPSCNPDMWQENVLNHIVRLSAIGTTFASFSVAGVLKRGLKQHGITITRPRGFGHKREMLKAIWQSAQPTDSVDHLNCSENSYENKINLDNKSEIENNNSTHLNHDVLTVHSKQEFRQRKFAIIGAGIAGLTHAYMLACRGHQVVIYDKSAPLAEGSGNPLALLNPKLSPIEQSAEHLMTISWPYALQFYQKFKAFRPLAINQIALKDPEENLAIAEQYPEATLKVISPEQSEIKTEFSSLQLTQAGAVYPDRLKDEILEHPLIEFKVADISSIQKQSDDTLKLLSDSEQIDEAYDHVIVCAARHSKQFFPQYPELKPVRGQVSWVRNPQQRLDPKLAYSFGGYCMQLDHEHLIMGASFFPNRDDQEVLEEDHVHNYELIHNSFPEYAQSLKNIAEWQGRASVRAQSPDYFPVLGKPDPNREVYSFAGMGSKGFLFTPLCTEVLLAHILGEACPVSNTLWKKLDIHRFKKVMRVRKPYYQKPAT